MKLIIAGGRNYEPTNYELARLISLLNSNHIEEIVSGGCSGVDKYGERLASDQNVPLKVFRADWDTHGRAAGPIRNRQMAEYADAVVLFPGGKGTKSMLWAAKKEGITIFDWRGVIQ